MSRIPLPTTEPVPFAQSPAGAPLAYEALGFVFHLEALVAEDAERLARATDRILAAVGPSLRWSWSSVQGEVEAFTPASLDLIAGLPSQLEDADAQSLEDPRAREGASAMNAAHYDRLGVACHGGADRNLASPWTVRFFARVTPAHAPLLRADAMLAVTMPRSTPTEALGALARAVAADLRIRWGAAGLMYGAWELDRYGETRDAIYAHARRHPGFDHGQHATWMRELHDHVRTVSWLTFLGPALTERVAARGPLTSDDLVAVEPSGEGVVFVAGERPEPGDVNRKGLPRAYVRADRRLRAVRAHEALGMHFYAPWSSATSEAWLRRFEAAG